MMEAVNEAMLVDSGPLAGSLSFEKKTMSLKFDRTDLRNSGCNNLFYELVTYRPEVRQKSQQTEFKLRPGPRTIFSTILPV